MNPDTRDMMISPGGGDRDGYRLYSPIDAVNGAGDVHVAAAGAGPDDGFSGYNFFSGGNTGRWGDYSAAVADSSGTIWIGHEFIPNAPRTLLANWGTFVSHVTP